MKINFNEIEEDIFNETPHFFPYIIKEKKLNILKEILKILNIKIN